LYERN
jgi:hypothetical protein